ncbi:MAG TPA: hypothetical protein VKA03_10005 [Methylovirgula sp.]|nr:hypothetical protein [Methylovirgula sp.]
MSQDEIEHTAHAYREACGVRDVTALDILDIIKNKAPGLKRTRGLTLVTRPDGFMGEREAYAVSSPNRIFAREALISRVSRGDGGARVILTHELSHIILHPGAEKAWMASGNITPAFIPEEESAEWQATSLSLAILADEHLSAKIESAYELATASNIDLKHAELRYEVLRRRRGRKLPEIYNVVRSELKQDNHSTLHCIIWMSAALTAVSKNYFPLASSSYARLVTSSPTCSKMAIQMQFDFRGAFPSSCRSEREMPGMQQFHAGAQWHVPEMRYVRCNNGMFVTGGS